MRILLLLLFPLSLFSQGKNSAVINSYPIDQHKCVSSFSKIKLNAIDVNAVEQVKAYLIANLKNLQNEKMELKLLSDIESPAARHLTFQQTYNSIPVYTAMVKANLNKEGDIISILDNSFITNQDLSSDFASQETIDFQILHFGKDAIIEYEKNYFFNGEDLLPLIKFKVFESSSKYFDMLVNSKGEQIYVKDLLKYDKQI